MTTKLVLGVDPGVAGAIAVLADGKFAGVFDMPVRERRNGRNEIDGYALGRLLREIESQHPSASRSVVVEEVNAMPPRREKNAQPCATCGHVKEGASMGATSAFQFGRSAGGVQYILEAYGYVVCTVIPGKWKRDTGLQGQSKDYSRTVAMQCYPTAARYLELKKHDGRAEAILLARWGVRNGVDQIKPPEEPEFRLEPTVGVAP